MERVSHLSIVSLLVIMLVLSGCPDARHAVVINQSSNNISSVDIISGTVTSDLGGLTVGPIANGIAVRGSTAYVVNSGTFPGSTNASVQVIDLTTNTIINTIPFPDGSNPWAIAFVNDTKAYVTCFYGNDVTVIDPTRSGLSAILRTIPLPVFSGSSGTVKAGPEGIIVAGGYAYTANTGYDPLSFGYVNGSVSIIDTATDTIVDADSNPANGIDTPIFTSQVNAQDLDVDAQGEINVICTGDYWSTFGVMDVIDPATKTVTASIPLGGSPGNITCGNNMAMIGAGSATGCALYVVKTDTNSIVNDSTNPWTLMSTSAWCTVGKIEVSTSGNYAYVPGGVYGGEARLFELYLQPGTLKTIKAFTLDPSANLPVAVGLTY